MQIVIFGLSVSSSWGNGHATLWRGLIGALSKRGHRVVFFERDVAYYAEHRDIDRLPGDSELILYREWSDAAPRARSYLAGADVALVTSYCPDGVAATRLVLDSPAQVKAFYDLDTPVTLDALRSGKPVSYLGPERLAGFDLVLSYTGGAALDALQAQLGARRVAPLYGSVDPDVHRRVAALDRFRSDLSYLGTYAEDRQPALEALFIQPARQLPESRFLIGGAMYPPDFPWTDNIFFVKHMPPAEHPAFFSSSRLTLNVTRRAMAEMGYCPSGRLFEAAACGTPVLSDDWQGMDAFFAPGEEILIARDTDDALHALTLSDVELAKIAAAARDRVLSEHTADQRAVEFEAAVSGAVAPFAGDEVSAMWGIIPAAGRGSRIQPLAFSKELLPVGSRFEGEVERPRAVSEYLIERMITGGVDKLCLVISPGKHDVLEYYGAGVGSAMVAYVVQAQPLGLCDSLFCALPLIAPDEQVLIGLPDTIWFPEDGFCALPDDRLSFLLFPVERPEFFDAVVTDGEGRVSEIQVKRKDAASNWVWGAFKMPGRVLRDLYDLWIFRNRQDEYVGTLVNAYLEKGGEAFGVRAGKTYVDVGTLNGYREAIRLLSDVDPAGTPHIAVKPSS